MPATAPAETRPPPCTPVRPELLAPAGDWECARAAVENGADAIYFGLERFNARMRAKNFTVADLPKLMEFLHRRGVKGYVTFNVLVFADEMTAAAHYLRAIIATGVDAAIVQDIGICRMIRAISPDFPIHTSTQMTVTSSAGVDFARELGANLVVLAREKAILEEKNSGKPANVMEKIIASGLKSYAKDNCLLEQVYVHDGSKTVAQAVAEAGNKAGAPLVLKAFNRMQLGEGIEKTADDFAAEVAKMSGQG